MAVSSAFQHNDTSIADNASDYGSDLDDDAALELVSQAESQPLNHVVLESIDDEALQQRINLRLSRLQHEMGEAAVEIEYDEDNRRCFSPFRPTTEEEAAQPAEAAAVENDTRSPIERFRKPPKKPLSVTDLVSPAWCEQQYEYSLSKYGRIRKTPAMKQGSTVHKELEEQVRGVEVVVETKSKEDRFGLQIWNTIQGLRILRETGMTRELQVWGVIEGEVVIGIIDEITTTCPDEHMEMAMLEDAKNVKSGAKRSSGRKMGELSAGQSTLTNFLTSSQTGSVLENNPAFLGTVQQEKPPMFYIKDLKTRQSRRLPALGSPSRPTHMQLMIYHRLLSMLAANEVPAETIFERYKLDPNAPFTDTFVAEIANLDVASRTNDAEDTQDSLTELLEHNTLSHLWALLTSEFARTIPIHNSQSSPSISPVLTAEFRTALPKTNAQAEVLESPGTLLGQRSFPFDAAVIDRYIHDEMAWWKGERPTKGVEVEEAFKCRMCDFAEGCTWRATKVEEGIKKARLRGESRNKSAV